MQFLRIENPVQVVPSMEMLCTIGVSSSRGTEKIGQFGSGHTFFLALFAREGLLEQTKICAGKDVYTHSLKSKVVKTSAGDDFVINEIIMKKQNGPSVNLNISDQFGAVDWHGVEMGLREVISNAIDGSLFPSDVKIDIVDENQCRAKDRTIRVYIPATDEVREYVANIHRHFPCLSPTYNPDRTIIPNRDGGPTLMCRKGVKVGSFGQTSLFHYNIHDLQLKESRVVDSYHAREKAAHAIVHSDVPTIVTFLHAIDADKDYWEKDLSPYDFGIEYKDETVQKKWTEAYKTVWGNTVLCETPEIAHIVRSKGHQAKVFGNFARMIKQIPGVKQSSQVLTLDEVEDRAIISPTPDVQTSLDMIWGFLQDNALTNGKDKPFAHCFNEITKQEGTRLGFYRDGGVYIHQDIANRCPMLTQTMIEEVAHHVTGARDCTRDFQDFAFRLAGLLLTYVL